MTIGELKEKLDEYGDHVEVTSGFPDDNKFHTIDAIEDWINSGHNCVLLVLTHDALH